MEVEDVLPGAAPRVLAEVDAYRAKFGALCGSDPMRRGRRRSCLLLRDRPQVSAMRAGNDEDMSPGRRRLAQKRHDGLVLVHDFLRAFRSNDPAKGATLFHRCSHSLVTLKLLLATLK